MGEVGCYGRRGVLWEGRGGVWEHTHKVVKQVKDGEVRQGS